MPARTGAQFLEGLRNDNREIWLNGERIKDVTNHPEFEGAAHSIARLYDLQHENADIMLTESPITGDKVGTSFMIPRSKEDLKRIQQTAKIWAESSAGIMGRSPDYLNVTFACYASRLDVWRRNGNEQGAKNLENYFNYIRENDLCLTHSIINPQVDRSIPEVQQGEGDVALHKVGETEDSIIVRGARMLATLAPFSDELTVYPSAGGKGIRPEDKKYALCFALPMETPGLKFLCRDSYSKQRDKFDYPLSSRFDEMDAVVIFDDVHIPKERVFLDGDTELYRDLTDATNWRAYIVFQAMTRALTKLEFIFGLGHKIADMNGVNKFDHVQEKLGEIWTMMEMTRSGLVAAIEGSSTVLDGIYVPDEKPLIALRGLMPKWIPRAMELIRLIGGGGFMLTPSKADMEGPLREYIDKYYQARNAPAEEKIRLFRLAWDFIGSDMGSRGELYERFYLLDSYRMTAIAYLMANKDKETALVDKFLEEMALQDVELFK
ncbi:4-hydroxyphenylacetate 3-monooxygenase, oxygenase component [Bacillus sp. FJAT-45350]|uniref:4-hydroxyphenylacetate 3-monooxygenase, oxygenase component n=1 Tax=Bacillus sp. FJAT-45350 TaxID=2011014 RepID=UPI000BB9B078|nr:4-hydroxyphenylacetate 3-monooxygenase, oxygenase component [Bacillus sp. FJAT-45350]